MRNKDDVLSRLSHNLILGHISNKILRDGIVACSYVAEDHRSEFIANVVGIYDDKVSVDESKGSDIKHLDTTTILNMNDKDRMKLYEEIIKSVNNNDSK